MKVNQFYYELTFIGLVYDLIFQLTDSLGASTYYKLSLQALINSKIELNQIPNVSLVNPQNYTIRYYDILNSELYYNLNSSISLVNGENEQTPSWMVENKTFYQLVMTSKFNYESEISFKFKFKVTDLCGDEHYTNTFTVTLMPNKPPTIVNKIDNGIFYEGMLIGKIPVASELFADPGDTLAFFTTRWIEDIFMPINATYMQSENSINISYPPNFIGNWTMSLLAKDSANNIAINYFQVTINSCAQSQWIVWSGSKVSDWGKWDENNILNLKTGECIPILTIWSFASIKFNGMFIFFFIIFIIFPVSKIFSIMYQRFWIDANSVKAARQIKQIEGANSINSIHHSDDVALNSFWRWELLCMDRFYRWIPVLQV